MRSRNQQGDLMIDVEVGNWKEFIEAVLRK